MARVGVVFSSGFFGFFAHAGFLSALREVGVEPVGYAGASSGAILAAMAASGMSDEEIKESLFTLKRFDFWDPDPLCFIMRKALGGFRGYTGYLQGGGYRRLLEGIPIRRIEDSPVPLVIVATNLTLRKEERFSKGPLPEALHASGAVPGLFKPAEIDGRLYVDGGMVNKAPVQALADRVRPDKIIVHFITSRNIGGHGVDALRKRWTPWHIYQLAVNISRQEAYRKECERVLAQGIEIQEVRTNAPGVGPSSLKKGPMAYDRAREEAHRIILSSSSHGRKG